MLESKPIKIDFLKEKNPDKLKELIGDLLTTNNALVIENEALKKKYLNLLKPTH